MGANSRDAARHVSATPVTPDIVTVAVPLFVLSNTEVAVTVSVPAVSPEFTVSRPLVLMPVVVSALPVTDHTTLSGMPLPAVTIALNCCLPPLFTEGVAGVTVTEVTAGCC